MGQIGNTDFINATTNSVDLITDTYIDKVDADGTGSGSDVNYSTAQTVVLTASGDDAEKAVIMNIKIPERNEVLDVDSNAIPEDAVFSDLQMQLNVTSVPASDAVVNGFILDSPVSIEAVTHQHSDGASAGTDWNPDFSVAVTGNSIYKSKVISQIVTNSGGTGMRNIEFINLRENELDWGKTMQIIFYSSVTMTIGLINNSDAAIKPDIKIFFDKPVPAAPAIEVIPDAGGINGIINITPSTDKAVVKHSLAWSTATTAITTHGGHNPLDIDDIGRTKILTSEFIKAAAAYDGITVFNAAGDSGIAYAEIAPLAFDSGNSIDDGGGLTGDIPYKTRFQLFAEDNYNTNANGGASNIVTIARPAITLTDSASGAIAIGDENTFTLTTSKNATTGAGLGNYEGQFLSYAFYPSVDDIVYDTGVTLSGSLSSNATDEFEIVSSDVSFELGDVIKIDDEYMRIVGFKGEDKIIDFVRGALGSTIASHSVSAPIYKVDDTKLLFTQLTKPTALHTFTYKYPKANSAHTAIAYVKDIDGWRSDPAHIAVNVSEADPIAKISASRTIVPYAQYGDNSSGLTVSLSNSKAIGTDNEITNYLFSYRVGKGSNSTAEPQPMACANGLTNDNSCFDSGSKRVAIVNCGANEDHSDAKFKIFGVASFYDNAGTETVTIDTDTSLDIYYKTVTETITVNAARLTESLSTNFYKSIDCIVAVDISANDAECTRYILKVANADVELNEGSPLHTSGGTLAADATTLVLDTPNTRNYSVGDYVKLESEIILITAIPSLTNLTVLRGMFFSTAATHADNVAVEILSHDVMVNRDLRIAGNEANIDAEGAPAGTSGEYWRWGGFARVVGDDSASGIDFDTDETIELQTVLDDSCTGAADEDWHAQGFIEGDIIKVGNTTNNGTYVAPKYFKIIKMFWSGGTSLGPSRARDVIKIADSTNLLTDNEALYMTTSIGTGNTNMPADIVRYDNALNPTRSVTLSSFNSSTDAYVNQADDFIFSGGVIDSTDSGTDEATATAPWKYRLSHTSTKVRGVGVRTLDLDALASSGHIAILNTSISRNGGVAANMPLGDRKYPISGLNTKLGLVQMSGNFRVLTQEGLRTMWSLVEGDKYDFVFLDSKKIDTPTTAYKSYRMKVTGGSISQSPQHASQYLAAIKFAVVGEEIA